MEQENPYEIDLNNATINLSNKLKKAEVFIATASAVLENQLDVGADSDRLLEFKINVGAYLMCEKFGVDNSGIDLSNFNEILMSNEVLGEQKGENLNLGCVRSHLQSVTDKVYNLSESIKRKAEKLQSPVMKTSEKAAAKQEKNR